jgi:hypothetical protein
MTIDEVRAALSARGWTLHIRKRRARSFAYAARRDGNKVQERYLAALDAPELPAVITALPNRQQPPASNVAQPAPAKTPRIAPQQNRPAPVQPTPAEQQPRQIAPPVAQPAKADRRLSPAGTIRAHLRVLGWKSDYREVWFALDDMTSCKIPGGQALWNDWCEDMPEEVIRKAVTEMEKRLDIPALLIWKE